MTLNDVQRAELALYAARAAGEGASLEQMKAICYCIRNRVKAGWHDGQWLTVMEYAGEVIGNETTAPMRLDPSNRQLQRLVADIDEIYYGARYDRDQAKGSMNIAQRYAPEGGDLEDAVGKCCYWCFVNRPYTKWFFANILARVDEHPMRAQMGLMMFFE